MTSLGEEIKKANECIFDNNEHKLYVNKTDTSDVFEYILRVKSTNIFVEKGTMDYNSLMDASKKYFMCYLDGYAFDIIDDNYL
jgi:hypothetical protein